MTKLQQDNIHNYVLTTEEPHNVRVLTQKSFRFADMSIWWEGHGIPKSNGKVVANIDPSFYEPDNAKIIFGNIEKEKKKLGRTPKTSYKELVPMMTKSDLQPVRRGFILAKI